MQKLIMMFCPTAANEGVENRNPRFYHYFTTMCFVSIFCFSDTVCLYTIFASSQACY